MTGADIMSDILIIQDIDNKKSPEYGDSIKEGLRLSAINMAINIGTFRVNVTVDKSIELIKKRKKNYQYKLRMKEAIKTKNQRLIERSMYNFLI
jgi:hypothetical protein